MEVYQLGITACELKEIDKKNIVKCLGNAIGDDLLACLRREGIHEKRSNGKATLKWDFINRNIVLTFSGSKVTADYTHRGAWYMVPLIDKENGFLFTLMREERFKELSKKQEKRRKAHYIDALVRSFNMDLDIDGQMSMFKNVQFESTEINNIVQDILKDIQIDSSIIKRHAVILFDEYNSELISVRCCALNSKLQIVAEEKWTSYITHSESVVVDVVDKNEKALQMPEMPLKKRAKEKIGQRVLVDYKEKKDVSEKNIN